MYEDPRHHPILNLICCGGIFVILSANGQGHPSSHVDAWARIETHLDIRVTLFLDDVLALQSIRGRADNSLIPAPLAAGAMEIFAETLPSLLMVYDADGRRVQGRIQERPTWQPARRGVDLEADGGLRLAWKLRYPWNQTHASFSIQHRFVEHRTRAPADMSESQDTPPIPAELRLRVRNAASGRRVDTVIDSHQPHTIVLPAGLSGFTNQQNQIPTTARFVVLPRRLVHEFTVPLVLVSEAIRLNEQETTSDIHYPTMDASITRKLAATWIQHKFQLLIDGRLSTPQSTFVGLLTAENEQIDDLQTIPLVGTRLGIRTTHDIHDDPLRVSVSWNNGPSHVREIHVHTIHGASSTWQLAECHNEDSGPGTLNYECNLQHNALLAGRRDNLKPLDSGGMMISESANLKFRDHQLWPAHSLDSILHWSMWVVLVVAGIAVVTGIRRKRRTWATTAMLTFVTVATLVITLPRRTVEPNPEIAALLLNQMLSRTYRAVLALNEQAAVDRLSEVLTDDMVETIFKQIAENAENAPFVRINDVQIASCTPQSFVSGEYAIFHCKWQIDGEIVHWGHRHQRNRLFTGVIRLDTMDSRYRIADISLESTESSKS